jgi:hypothetical protein
MSVIDSKYMGRALALAANRIALGAYGLLWLAAAVSAESNASLANWPAPGMPMEQLPALTVQGLSEQELAKARPGLTESNCRTKFWPTKPKSNQQPFMVALDDGQTGFAKLNDSVLVSRGIGGGGKLGTTDDASSEKIPLQNFYFRSMNGGGRFASRERYIQLELKKTSERFCGWGCRAYTAEAYLYWRGMPTETDAGAVVKDEYLDQEGARQGLRTVYIEDRCHHNRYNRRLFMRHQPPNLFERVIGFFFSKG